MILWRHWRATEERTTMLRLTLLAILEDLRKWRQTLECSGENKVVNLGGSAGMAMTVWTYKMLLVTLRDSQST